MTVINKLFCPICGKDMCADVHAPEDGAIWNPTYPNSTTESFRKMDNWICLDHPNHHHCVVFVREDIENWLEKDYKKESGL